jgi:hypothetical protein
MVYDLDQSRPVALLFQCPVFAMSGQKRLEYFDERLIGLTAGVHTRSLDVGNHFTVLVDSLLILLHQALYLVSLIEPVGIDAHRSRDAYYDQD